MKFGHDYSQTLGDGEFPQEWIDSAISYKQLKKCIKKVQKELQSLGLDTKTLDALWKAADGEDSLSEDERQRIIPKMIVAMDPNTGSPQDAWLTEETRQSLQKLAGLPRDPLPPAEVNGDLLALAVKEDLIPDAPYTPGHTGRNLSDDEDDDVGNDAVANVHRSSVPLEEIEMPLISNSEFFQVLRKELARLDELQAAEQRRLEDEIKHLGKELTTMVAAGSKKSKTDTQAWREIFRIYVESEIFFSARERDHGTRNSEKASQQLENFVTTIKRDGRAAKLTREGRIAFERFIQINNSLLQYLRFQELNQTALKKIMKKFDKRTALHAQTILPAQFAEKPFIAQSLARSACLRISEDLITMIPQLNDYLCPICFNVSYKPIRLTCEHVFCVRCLIVMQRARQDHCPLCRSKGVMGASSDNLDLDLMSFLKTNFPREVKAKQKENEYAAGVDMYGDDYDKVRCTLM